MSIGGRRVGTPATRVKPTLASLFSAAPFLETFPNDGALGTATEDLTWIAQFGTPVVASGVLTAGGSGDGGATVDAADTTGEDMFVQIDVVSGLVGLDNQIYLVGRTDDTFTPGVVLNVISGTSGATTPILIYDWAIGGAGYTNVGANLFTGTWRLELDGDEGRAYRDGVLMLTTDITGFSGSGNTRAGLEVTAGTGGAPTFDNFSFFDL